MLLDTPVKICVIPIDKEPTEDVACNPVKPMSNASRTIPLTVAVIPRPVNPTVSAAGSKSPTLDSALKPVGIITEVKTKVKPPTAEAACTPVIPTKFWYSSC